MIAEKGTKRSDTYTRTQTLHTVYLRSNSVPIVNEEQLRHEALCVLKTIECGNSSESHDCKVFEFNFVCDWYGWQLPLTFHRVG